MSRSGYVQTSSDRLVEVVEQRRRETKKVATGGSRGAFRSRPTAVQTRASASSFRDDSISGDDLFSVSFA